MYDVVPAPIALAALFACFANSAIASAFLFVTILISFKERSNFSTYETAPEIELVTEFQIPEVMPHLTVLVIVVANESNSLLDCLICTLARIDAAASVLNAFAPSAPTLEKEV